MKLSAGWMFQTEQSGIIDLIFRKELSEPGLHDEPLPIKMCEVILQGGNVRLETSNSEYKPY